MRNPAYTGIGSRSTPPDVLDLMERQADRLRWLGYILRSGHAPGADQAWERGAGPAAECYLPWQDFESGVEVYADIVSSRPRAAATEAARELHPAWHRLGRGGQAMHARNVHQVLGRDLRTPSKFVLCWTPRGEAVGGTATAIHLARFHRIPVLNLADADDRRRVESTL